MSCLKAVPGPNKLWPLLFWQAPTITFHKVGLECINYSTLPSLMTGSLIGPLGPRRKGQEIRIGSLVLSNNHKSQPKR